MKIVKTHTGKIYVDADRQLEFLTVGDYGKENNIKADFLGLHKEINGVANTEVDLTDKWVATVSTQKGCPMKCKFCDCPPIWLPRKCYCCRFNLRSTDNPSGRDRRPYGQIQCSLCENGRADIQRKCA